MMLVMSQNKFEYAMTYHPVKIEFGDEYQDLNPQPIYELVESTLVAMVECPRRYGADRTGFVLALIPWIELLMHDQEDEALLDWKNRDPIYEELCEQLLGGRDEENKQAPDLVWAKAVIDYVVKYVVERREQLMEVLPRYMANERVPYVHNEVRTRTMPLPFHNP